jgi:hypothetical protein
VIGALWDLARWAREPWRPWRAEEYGRDAREARRQRLLRIIDRAGFVVSVVVIAALFRRIRP